MLHLRCYFPEPSIISTTSSTTTTNIPTTSTTPQSTVTTPKSTTPQSKTVTTIRGIYTKVFLKIWERKGIKIKNTESL